jgi:hypothetical protein
MQARAIEQPMKQNWAGHKTKSNLGRVREVKSGVTKGKYSLKIVFNEKENAVRN